ncbi:MAG: MFS transporter [Reyranella sp.]|nr:MAG: MFS transporter [Reyranella sp.]
MVAAFQVGKAPPALPSIREDLGATLEQAGWLLSVINLMTALGGMAIALTADRVGHRRLAIFGTLLAAAASFAGAFAPNVESLLVGRIFEGLGFITVVVAIPSLLLRLTRPGDQRLAMAIWSTYMPAGSGTMMVIAAIVLPATSWRVVWLVAAAAATLMAIALLLRAVPRRELDPLPVARRSGLSEMKEVGTSGGPLAIGVCFGAYACCWFAIIGFLPTMLIERLGYSTSTAAVITAFVAILNVTGNLGAGWLLHRRVRRVTVIVGATLSMSLCAAGIFVSGVPDLARLMPAE